MLLAVITVRPGAQAAPNATAYGPTPYLSFADSPFNSLSFSYFYLEDFEDHLFNTPGASADGGGVNSVISGPTIHDSVDADDGAIDGSGLDGDSYIIYPVPPASSASPVRFSFNAGVLGSLPTHVGIVWTDGLGTTLFEAFDAFGAPIEVIGPVAIADGSINGETAEDRFFGASHSGGISSVRISNTIAGMEVDHLQYGGIVPDLPGCITIVKSTQPPGGTGFNFGWTGTTTGGAVIEGLPFTLDDGGSEQICDLPPGTYSFGEFQPPPAGWTLINVVCNGGAGILIGSDSDFDQGDAGVTIPLAAGENVTCTFTNTEDINIVGGVVELLGERSAPSAADSGSAPGDDYAVFALAAAAAAVTALLAGAWYARRRFRQKRARL